VRVDHEHVDRAVAEDRMDGFTALALDGKGRVVGATIVAPRAGEMLAEVTAAVKNDQGVRDLAGVIHPYPAWSDGPWNAALEELRGQLERPLVRRTTTWLRRLRRWWLRRRG
jgi:pyruvate/2-oxoglutarate dehydrogenase complex dihydrolipoamide dehydrogenase (E3) component